MGWAAPDSDGIRWQSVLEALRNDPRVSPEHINAVEREVGNSVRYRPEQVAGAAAIRKRRPVKYQYAKSLGIDVVRLLRGEQPVGEFRLSRWGRLLDRLGLA